MWVLWLFFVTVLSHPYGPDFIPAPPPFFDFGTTTEDNVRPEYRSLDATGNNVANPEWGTIYSQYVRTQTPASYYSGPVDPSDPNSPLADPSDGIDPTLPNPRYVSHKLFEAAGKETPNDVLINQLHFSWGHLITADAIDTQYSAFVSIPGLTVQYPIPPEDWWYDESWGEQNPGDGSSTAACFSDPFLNTCKKSNSYLEISRMWAYPGTGAGTGVPKEAYSDSTHFLDLSVIYGTPATPQQLYGLFASNPYFEVGINGELLNWGKFIFADAGYDPVPGLIPQISPGGWMAAGDFRINKTPALRVLCLTFMKEHNRLVDEFRDRHPSWSNLTLFHEARRLNIAFFQAISVREYLAAAVGQPAVPYTGYNPEVNPSVDVTFAMTAFRYGHTALPSHIPLLDNDLNSCPYGVTDWRDVFIPALWSNPDEDYPYFDPETNQTTPYLRRKYDYESMIRGLANSLAMKVDLSFSDVLRNFMFQQGGPRHGDDLLMRDVFRARDMGVPLYNAARQHLGLGRAQTFADITSSKVYQGMLEEIYGDVDRVDTYVGAFAEDHPNVEMGPFAKVSILEQFTRWRDGDRFWYENPDMFTPEEIEMVYTTKLRDLISRNWDVDINSLPLSSFFLNERQLVAFKPVVEFPPPIDHPKGYPWANLNLTDVYKLYWAIDRSLERREIIVQIMVQTDGWAGIGFAPESNGTMKGADIVLCRIFDEVPECRDSRAFDVGVPILDTDASGEMNLWNVSVSRTDGILHAMFTRYLDNDDDPEHDNEIGDNLRIIFAFNPVTNDLLYHGPTRNPDTIIDFEKSYRGPPEQIPINEGVTGILYALCAIGVILSLSYIAIVIAKKDYFRFQTPEFCILVNFGAILGYISILLILPTSQNNGTCKAHLWLFGMSFWIVFVGFFAKVARVYYIVKTSNEKLEVVTVPISYMLIPLAIFMLAEMVFNICWDTLVPPDLSIELFEEEFRDTYVAYCAGNKWFWLGSVIWRACFLGAGVLLALETKEMQKELNWAKEIAASIYTMAIILGIGIPIGFFVSDSSTMVVILKGLALCIAYISVTFIIHSDSLIRIAKGKDAREQTRSAHGVSRTTGRTTGAGTDA